MLLLEKPRYIVNGWNTAKETTDHLVLFVIFFPQQFPKFYLLSPHDLSHNIIDLREIWLDLVSPTNAQNLTVSTQNHSLASSSKSFKFL